MISDCILAGDDACKGLTKRHKACGTIECPFYKTVQQEQRSQQKAKKRLDDMGVKFKTLYPVAQKKQQKEVAWRQNSF